MRAVLLLNSSYLPIETITIRKAINLLFREKAEAISDEMEVVYKEDIDYNNFPRVLRLLKFSGLPIRIKLSKKNILKRDRYRCAYCGDVFQQKELTVDHIVPKSRGGDFSWENLICSCIKDNNKKGDRTLEEANMELIFPPRVPRKMEVMADIIKSNKENSEFWGKFIKQ